MIRWNSVDALVLERHAEAIMRLAKRLQAIAPRGAALPPADRIAFAESLRAVGVISDADVALVKREAAGMAACLSCDGSGWVRVASGETPQP